MMDRIRQMYLDAQRRGLIGAESKEMAEYWRGQIDAFYTIYVLSQNQPVVSRVEITGIPVILCFHTLNSHFLRTFYAS